MNFIRSLILSSLIVLVSCSPVIKYGKLPEVKSWEPDIERFDSLDKSVSYPADAVMFAGSSSIRLWSTLASDMEPYHVIQRGYGGAKFSDFVYYADRIFSPHQCRALVLFIANDITGSKDDKTPDEVRDLFVRVLKIFRKSHPSTPLFYIEVTPTPLRWKAWLQASKANELIKKECERRHNVYFISTSKAFLDEKGQPRPELFRNDRLHLNPEGYSIWTKIIKARLAEVIGNQNSSE